MSSAIVAAAAAGVVVLATLVVVLLVRASASRRVPTADHETAKHTCKRCGQPIVVDPNLSHDVFEGMHWLCFHLEFEHSTDPDLPCTDVAGCPWWTIRYYEDRLRQLGLDPSEVKQQGMEEQLNLSVPGRDG